MVSLRNYFTSTIVIVILFFMFQFSGVAREVLNDYTVNPYAEGSAKLSDRSSAYVAGEGSSYGQRGEILYIGAEQNPTRKVVQNWASYMKLGIWFCNSLEESQGLEEAKYQITFEMAVIDSKTLDWENEETLKRLKELAEEGTDLVFADLPDVSVIERNKELQNFLGINGVREKNVTAAGLHLYGGFLLGGEQFYRAEDEEAEEKRQDMQLEFPWYLLATGTKTYMSGIIEEEGADYMNYPPIIWRNNLESAFVFVINGDYMEGIEGLGLLSAMSAQTKEYEIYPVVNAQNLVILNYPGLAEENKKEMRRRYNRSSSNVLRDIVWPDIMTAYEKSGFGLSAMIAPQYNYEDGNLPEQDKLIYYMKLLNEKRAEAGLSGLCISDTGLTEKLREDDKLIQKTLPEYRFTSFYAADLPEEEIRTVLSEDILSDIRTVVEDDCGDGEIIGYMSDQVTKQSVLSDGLRYTYSEDFRNKCVETALGYSSVYVDVAEVIYPADNGNETWREISKSLAGDLYENWKEFHAFSGTTVSECDSRIRNFLSLEYQVNQSGNKISLEVSNFEETVWFLLRMNLDTDVRIEGGKLKAVEEGVYLIEAENENVVLTLSQNNNDILE
ncbi:MAG: DUF2194 domain-containing protein [Hespellia sp.]|nr:DUF2194 domain-containing protein [Hespellia sp.]